MLDRRTFDDGVTEIVTALSCNMPNAKKMQYLFERYRPFSADAWQQVVARAACGRGWPTGDQLDRWFEDAEGLVSSSNAVTNASAWPAPRWACGRCPAPAPRLQHAKRLIACNPDRQGETDYSSMAYVLECPTCGSEYATALRAHTALRADGTARKVAAGETVYLPPEGEEADHRGKYPPRAWRDDGGGLDVDTRAAYDAEADRSVPGYRILRAVIRERVLEGMTTKKCARVLRHMRPFFPTYSDALEAEAKDLDRYARWSEMPDVTADEKESWARAYREALETWERETGNAGASWDDEIVFPSLDEHEAARHVDRFIKFALNPMSRGRTWKRLATSSSA